MNRENKRKQYDKHYYKHNPCNDSFTCKCCGAESREPLRSWKKKPQKDKNVCPWCIERRRVAAQTKRERLDDAAYGATTLKLTWE